MVLYSQMNKLVMEEDEGEVAPSSAVEARGAPPSAGGRKRRRGGGCSTAEDVEGRGGPLEDDTSNQRAKKAKKKKRKLDNHNDGSSKLEMNVEDNCESTITHSSDAATHNTQFLQENLSNSGIDVISDSNHTTNYLDTPDSRLSSDYTHSKQPLDSSDAQDQAFAAELQLTRSFDVLRRRVSPQTMAVLDGYGFEKLTEIQARAIPPLLERADLRATAKTGSGKTLAFLVPAFELLRSLDFTPDLGTGLIVLSPTRELAMQTYERVQELGKAHGMSHGLLIGGVSRKAERKVLIKGINVLVATPGRMLDHLKNTQGFLYANLVCLVIDEADRMLSIGFEEEMKAILKTVPKRRQTMLFSATRDEKTDAIVKVALKMSLVEVDAVEDKASATVDQVKQYYLTCSSEDRLLVLYTFLKRKMATKKIMVFFGSCDVVRFYSDLLNTVKVPVWSIHGKKKQSRRTEAFFEFSAAKSGALLCTDIAARGWDIPEVDWIVQFDAPESPAEYIHRVGRTARGGKEGAGLLMLRPEEQGFLPCLRGERVLLQEMKLKEGSVANVQQKVGGLFLVRPQMAYVTVPSGFCYFFLLS